jgi:cobalamin biosynthesis protein CobC
MKQPFGLFPIDSPAHGADIEAASVYYRIPTENWLDLSAAINPFAYPLSPLSSEALRQLPYSLRPAQEAATHYCSAPVSPVFAAGSQVLIQWLPLVHRNLHAQRRRVAVPTIGYAEHAFRWRWAGYDVTFYDPRMPEQIDELLRRDAVDVLVVISPHNPLAHAVAPRQLLAWHAALQRNQGWLIVDEAFIDAMPHFSLSNMTDMPGLVVLRSLGKFFGLAGVRCGYAFCHRSIAKPLEVAIGPWPLSSTALFAATQALRDENWQQLMRKQLLSLRRQNAELLMNAPWVDARRIYHNALFNSIELPAEKALAVEDYFAQRAIRVRRFDLNTEMALLRFGLVDSAQVSNWSKLKEAINAALV